jgi:hypothetical protein
MENKLRQVEDMMTTHLRVGTHIEELHKLTLSRVLADICIVQRKILIVAAFVIKERLNSINDLLLHRAFR